MKLRNYRNRLMAGFLAGTMLLTSAVPQTTAKATESAQAFGEISVNPQIHYQTLDGWGTSMCWWGNIIGSWGDEDYNNNGTPDREEIAELCFSPDYLNLNIVRYNVGGGDKTPTSMKRVEGMVPGWTVDMTGSEDGTGEFNAEEFYNKDITEMNDAGQLWMLDQANKYRKELADETGKENDIINEVFSNSPPYYMTKSGSSTGGVEATSNLKEDCYDDFATYMARAAKWIDNYLGKTYGTSVDYIEPMNEPDTKYWANGSTKQEGCTFDPGEEMSDMLSAMKTALEAEDIDLADKVEIQATDETDLKTAISSFNALDANAKNAMTTIGAHTYSGTDDERHILRKLAASYDKDLWMSEITKGKDGNGHDETHESMELANTKGQSESMMADLKYMQPSAWVAWLVADSEYECLKVDGNWGLIHCVFESDGPVSDYHTNLFYSNGVVKENVPEAGYWAVTKQFYVMMQYSKYLKAGYTMIDIGDENMCAAISPDGTELVIVAQNFSDERTTTVDLNKFENLGTAICYQTSDATSCEKVGEQSVADGVLDVTLPTNSVSTYVIDLEADVENYVNIVEADIATPTETDVTVSDMNKFTYTGTWDGQSTTEAGASATFKFNGTGAIIYGTKSATGAVIEVSVDGDEVQTIDLSSEDTLEKAAIFNTGTLVKGDHTITMTVVTESAGKTFALNSAYVVQGDLGEASGTIIRKTDKFSGALRVHYDEVIGVSEYTVKYGTAEDNLDQNVKASGNSAVIKGLTDGTTYYIQVEDDLGRVSNIISAEPGAQDESVYYFVNVGTQSIESLAADEVFGAYNSTLDQAYGADSITGKKWGYVGTTNEPAYRDGDRWTSIRYSKNMNPLEYKFDLPAGTYNVTVGMLDPWKNSSRKTDIIIGGETKATNVIPTTKTMGIYQATLKEDGTLSVVAQPSSGNTSQDAIISFIEIKAQDDNAIVKATPETIVTVRGVVPQLPSTVKAQTVTGAEIDVAVTWESIHASDFDVEDNTTVTLTGTLESGMEVTQEVKVVPANMQYYIDCNLANSSTYTEYDAIADLLNETADQKYTEGSWGYLDAYGNYDGNVTNDSGWYAKSEQSIQYKIPLNAGTYKVIFGFTEWWDNRSMNLMAYYGDESISLGNITYSAKGNYTKEAELKLDDSQIVTLSVEKASKDPVLSWFMITNMLDHSNLKPMLEKASVLDRTGYTEEQLSALESAVSVGMNQLFKSSATQVEVDAAAEALEEVFATLPATEEDVAEVSAKITVAEGIDTSNYTEESVAALNQAIANAKEIAEKTDATQNDVVKAIAAIQSAIEALETKPIVPEEVVLTKENLTANDYVLYTVNAGTPDATVVPVGEKLGLLQSNVDQVYGADAKTTARWGYAPADANSEMIKTGSSAVDAAESSMYLAETVTFDSEKSGLRYSFEVPSLAGIEGMEENDFEVTVGFYLPWSGSRKLNIKLEDEVVENQMTISTNTWITKTYTTEVTDGELNVLVQNPKRTSQYQDPIISFVRVKAVQMNITDLQEAVTSAQSKDAALYTQDSYMAVASALEKANALLENPGNSQQAVDEATSTLKKAVKKLITIESVEYEAAKTELNTSIETAQQKINGLNEADYTKDSWKAVLDALAVAKVLAEKDDVTVKELVDAKEAVTKAIDGLKATEQGTPDSGTPDQGTPNPPTQDGGQTGGVTDTTPTEVKVSSIKITNKKVKIAAGKKVTLVTEVAPADATNSGVTWESSNTKYATVNASGVVTTKKKGAGKSVTVTATAKDGSGVKATVKVQIMKHAVKSIKLKAAKKQVVAGKKVKIKTTVKTTGKKVNKTLAWTSSNDNWATVSSKGVVSTKKAGKGKTVTITATSTDGTNKKAKVKIKIK